MELDEYTRYGRQMLVPEIGLSGQLAFKGARVLVVGAGGLACPCLPYLAGAGVGCIGIVDDDRVEVSNLHRQILHSEPGQLKAESAAQFLRRLNPRVEVQTHTDRFTAANAAALVKRFDVVVDCSDNAPTRYLANDACVLLGKPLVSAAALRLEGQLCVLNYRGGPCYRCLFPHPPAPELTTKCADSGVLGAVVGVLGALQAAEVLKVLLDNDDNNVSSLTLFSLYRFPQIKQVRVRPRQAGCEVCGTEPRITTLDAGNYTFPVCAAPDTSKAKRISVHELHSLGPDTLLVDCRSGTEFGICALPAAVNIPLAKLQRLKTREEALEIIPERDLVVVCRRGVDSVLAAQKLESLGFSARDVEGGLEQYSRIVDPSFPVY